MGARHTRRRIGVCKGWKEEKNNRDEQSILPFSLFSFCCLVFVRAHTCLIFCVLVWGLVLFQTFVIFPLKSWLSLFPALYIMTVPYTYTTLYKRRVWPPLATHPPPPPLPFLSTHKLLLHANRINQTEKKCTIVGRPTEPSSLPATTANPTQPNSAGAPCDETPTPPTLSHCPTP